MDDHSHCEALTAFSTHPFPAISIPLKLSALLGAQMNVHREGSGIHNVM